MNGVSQFLSIAWSRADINARSVLPRNSTLGRPQAEVGSERREATGVSQIKTGWIRVGDTVLSVCHSYDFKPEMGSPKHAGFCKVRMVYYSPLAIYLGTDCDAGSACSGGSLLSGNEEDPALLAITRSVGETKEMERKRFAEGDPTAALR